MPKPTVSAAAPGLAATTVRGEPIEKFNERIEGEQRARGRVKRQHLDALFAEWLTLRGPDIEGSERTERDELARSDREDELARLITTTPAVFPWMIYRKLEVLEYYIGFEGGTRWTDNREVVMLAGIKADLLCFQPSRRGED